MGHSRNLAIGVTLSLACWISLPTTTQAGSGLVSQSPVLPSVAAYFGTAPRNCSIADSSLVHRARGTNPFIWVGSGGIEGLQRLVPDQSPAVYKRIGVRALACPATHVNLNDWRKAGEWHHWFQGIAK